MPSVTDVQQTTLSSTTTTSGKSTPPPPSSSTDAANADPIVQAILVLEKKQRNLGKRKEKLESYEQEAKTGKELNKDQKDALAKYPEVLGQIDCVKELIEQFKKIQTESVKNQKRLSKQVAEDKRQLVSQRLREYAQIRYLFDHRPTSLKPEESKLLDELSSVIIPSDNSLTSISRSIDTVLSIYQGGQSSTTIKNLTGKTPQEVREILEELIKNSDIQSLSSSSSVLPSEQEQIQELNQTNNDQSSERNLPEHSLQFDTRVENIPIEQIIQDSPFFPEINNQIQENKQDSSTDSKQYLQTLTVVNSNINDQSSSSIENQQNEQQIDEQWQQQKGTGNTRGHFNNGNRNYNRERTNNYNQQQRRGGPREGWYDNSYGGNQRTYNENYRGRGGFNSNYRNNRGGNYRRGNRGYNNNANGYQQSAQYHQVHSAPPSQQQQQQQQ